MKDAPSQLPQQLADSPGRRRRRFSLMTARDKWAITGMVGIPTFLHIVLVWIPALITIGISFTKWNGFALDGIDWVGFRNYKQLGTVFRDDLIEGSLNNLWVLLFLFFIGTPLGMLVAYLLDKNLRGTALYQSLLYFPVVLSLAVVGFIWKSTIYSPRQGLLNTIAGRTEEGNQIDWLGDSDFVLTLPFTSGEFGLTKNFLVMIAPMVWQHVGYVMVLYLAGLKAVDPSLREAAAIDGSTEWQTFRNVVFPALRPVNIVIMVITVIQALRVFDIIDVLNNPNGTDVLSILVTEGISGESSNVGRGSAWAVVLLLLCFGFAVVYLRNQFREDFE